jgi:hypothetical protein
MHPAIAGMVFESLRRSYIAGQFGSQVKVYSVV